MFLLTFKDRKEEFECKIFWDVDKSLKGLRTVSASWHLPEFAYHDYANEDKDDNKEQDQDDTDAYNNSSVILRCQENNKHK